MLRLHHRLFVAFLGIAWCLATTPQIVRAAAYDYDISVQGSPISFVPAQFYAGDAVRIYGTVANNGNKDVTGYVAFYQGTNIIGEPQFFSSKANGAAEDFWIDWTPTEGSYNVALRVIKAEPTDQNPLNNDAVSGMMNISARPAPAPQAVPTPPAPAPTPTPTPTATQTTVSPAPTTITNITTPKPATPSLTVTGGTKATTNATPPLTEPMNTDTASLEEILGLKTDTATPPASNEANPVDIEQPKKSSQFSVTVILIGASILALILLLIGAWLYRKSRALSEDEE